MKHIHRHLAVAIVASAFALFSQGCGRAGGNFTGREYMPDMAHSVAYEAYSYSFFNNNRWGGAEGYRKFYDENILGAKPVANTIARGQKVYAYGSSEEERTRAKAEITMNLLVPKSEEQLKEYLSKGKALYNTYCSVCHGETGDGQGQIHTNDGPYTAAPAILIGENFRKDGDTEGRYYHAIVYGKGMMQPHADKLSDEERWMVIHHIRSLQADKDGTKYDLAAATKKSTAPAPAPAVDSLNTAPAPTPAPEEKKEEKKDDKKGKKKGSK